MQKWKCHKIVEAGEIEAMSECERCSLETVLHLSDGSQVGVSAAYMARHRPRVGGYYVRYFQNQPEGEPPYESFSPPEPFEAGYTMIDDGRGGDNGSAS
jgi:hypothetical protein